MKKNRSKKSRASVPLNRKKNCCKYLIAVSQSADGRNRLAAIVSIVGISLPLQFKQISGGTPISAISQKREAYCGYKSQSQFPVENAGKLSLVYLNGLSTISYLQRTPY
jgi:hypothetical protein